MKSKQIKVDKEFLMNVLGHVDALSSRVKELESKMLLPIQAEINYNEFKNLYNRLTEENMRALGINIIQK